MRRYIIEHPTRGVLKELDWTESEKQFGRFTVGGSRISGCLFTSAIEAFDALDRIQPERLRDACQVRREPTDEEVQSPNWREDAWKVVTREDLVGMTIPDHPVRTVSAKSLEPWKVAVLALGAYVDGHALLRKIGGRQSLEGLSIMELSRLGRALRPFVDLHRDVEAQVRQQADAMSGDPGGDGGSLGDGDSTEPSSARPSTPPAP